MLPKAAEIGSFFPKSVRNGACQEVVPSTDNFSLDAFPILKMLANRDGGRLHHLAYGHPTKNPEKTENGTSAVTACRSYDSRTTGMHWQRKARALIINRSSRAKIPMANSKVAGSHRRRTPPPRSPAFFVPPDMDEFHVLPAFLRKDPVDFGRVQNR